MSMTLTLVPLVIALGSTVSTASLAAVCTNRQRGISNVPTKYADKELLVKTLREHGIRAQEINDDHIVIRTDEGEIHFMRENKEDPYMMSAKGIRNMEKLAASLKEFEEEYGRNVQAYTYRKILEALEEHGLSLQEEEVLEDDSIMLTLNV